MHARKTSAASPSDAAKDSATGSQPPEAQPIRRTVVAIAFEALLLAGLGLTLALVANAVSPRGLRLNRDYFPGAIGTANRNLTEGPQASKPVSPGPESPVGNATSTPVHRAEAIVQRLQQRGLQLVSSNEVLELFRDPQREQGLVVFIDARDDQPYAAGHIPGAWQFHHFRAENFLPTVLPVCLTALKVVVYCNGGECEDSEFAAVVLGEAGVPRDRLFVYAGGVAEWQANRQPLETGARGSGAFTTPAPPAEP